MPLTEKQQAEWSAHLHDALEAVETAIKRLDQDDVEETDGCILDAQKALRRASDGIEKMRWDDDPEFRESSAADWFREAAVMHAFIDAFPREEILTEGSYLWRLREASLQKPPLQMPETYEDLTDGPGVELTVGCNTQFVTFEIKVASSGRQR